MSILPPRLSAVIPTHDTRELTLRCVESLAAQELEDLQIVVVDDGSEDGTAEALAVAQPSVEILRLEPPGGFTRAANLGLSRSGGDVLLLLNSDTEVQPGALAALLQAFARDDRLGAAGAVLHYPDGSPQWSGGREPDLLWFFGLASGLPSLLGRLRPYRKLKPVGAGPGEVAWVTGAALAMRRSVWLEAGPLDEGYRFYGQDLDLCLRLRDMGWKVELVPGFRVLHHHGATIGAREESGGRQHAELLWTDLLRWARKHRGDRWTSRAALALRAGAALRLAARSLAWPLLPAGRKPRWSAESRAFVRAARAVAAAQRQALNRE
ncbi:MAG TPA: glycosyltransferase family 2 protein [Thermoanaerobaculia bacterium]|nr:glycosyltransferase family 2 protein [Thermoanaerobaculia bacterium]